MSPKQKPSAPRNPVWGHIPELLLANFRMLLYFLPSLLCVLVYLYIGGLVFLLAGLLLLLPAAPAVTAIYDLGYQLTRNTEQRARRTFRESYKLNFRQSMGVMAVQLPFWATLSLVLLLDTRLPVMITLCMLVGCTLLMTFGALALSQVALVELPLGRILKDAVALIPMFSWRAVTVGAVQTLFLGLLVRYPAVAFPVVFFAGPTLLIVWSCHILWPGMQELVVDETP